MRRAILALLLSLAPAAAAAQGLPSANQVYAGPASGPAAAPTFRGLVGADLPAGALAQYHFFIGNAGGAATDTPLAGDCTYGATGIVCTKTNGVAFATLATKVSPVCADLTNAAASCSTDATNATNISSGTLSNSRLATAATADWEADTAGKLLTTDQLWGAGAFPTITYGLTTTIDLSTLVNGTITLTGNITTLNWNNCKAGQTGVIEFIQDGTGSRTVPVAWNSSFRWAGGTRGTLSTAANAVDWLFYQCKSATVAFVSLQKGLAN